MKFRRSNLTYIFKICHPYNIKKTRYGRKFAAKAMKLLAREGNSELQLFVSLQHVPPGLFWNDTVLGLQINWSANNWPRLRESQYSTKQSQNMGFYLLIEVSISKPNKTLESVDHNNENSNPWFCTVPYNKTPAQRRINWAFALSCALCRVLISPK